MTATPTESITSSVLDSPPQKSKSKVAHYFWIADGDFALQAGVDCRSICGRSWDAPTDDRGNIQLNRDGTVRPEILDCKLCVRGLNTELRAEMARLRGTER